MGEIELLSKNKGSPILKGSQFTFLEDVNYDSAVSAAREFL